MLCETFENQLAKNLTCKILSLQTENSISPLIFNESQQFWFQTLKLDYNFFKVKEILKIKLKGFVLLVITHRAFFFWEGGHPEISSVSLKAPNNAFTIKSQNAIRREVTI